MSIDVTSVLDPSAKAGTDRGHTDGGRGRELELKFDVDPGAVQDLLRHPLVSACIGTPRQSISIYYDTQGRSLRKAGMSLRVRETEGRCIQTIKADARASAGLFDRMEWEMPVPGPHPDLDRLADLGLVQEVDVRAGLRPVFSTRIARRQAVVALAGGRVEVVIDQGEVVAGSLSEPLCEVELELLEGAPAALFEVAAQLQSHAVLRLGVMSKSERGERLAEGRYGRVLKSEPLRLTSDMNVRQAFEEISFACLRHFRANEPLVMAERDADALHQARVALRRLRSAFSLFRSILKGPELDRFRQAMRDLASELGHARNLDVLLKRKGLDLAGPARKRLEEERERAYDAAIAALRNPATAAMIFDLVRWIALDAPNRKKRARSPVEPFASKVLARFWRKTKRRGRRLASLDDDERHELRISGKKLRYAGEFFAALYADARRPARDAFLSELEDLQDQLGALNDLATEQEMAHLLEQLRIAVPDVDGKELRSQRRSLLDASKEAFDRLERTGRYWRRQPSSAS